MNRRTDGIFLALGLALPLISNPALAQATLPAGESAQPASSDIVVTAQRRSQLTKDIPYNISALSGDQLTKAGTTSVNDIARTVSGLVTVDTGPATRGGINNFVLRGIRTDNPGGGTVGGDVAQQTVSTVSTYLGETPVFFPLQLKDIDRVEVLRGPQGTLYGSGAEAGTIRFIPNRPNFSAFSASVNGVTSYTQHGKFNGGLDGVVNIPLSKSVALRVVGGCPASAPMAQI